MKKNLSPSPVEIPRRLPVQIPLRYAGPLGVDESFLYRVNLRQRRLGHDLAYLLLDLAEERKDPELSDLRLEQLRPEMERAKKYLCKGCKFRNAKEE